MYFSVHIFLSYRNILQNETKIFSIGNDERVHVVNK